MKPTSHAPDSATLRGYCWRCGGELTFVVTLDGVGKPFEGNVSGAHLIGAQVKVTATKHECDKPKVLR